MSQSDVDALAAALGGGATDDLDALLSGAEADGSTSAPARHTKRRGKGVVIPPGPPAVDAPRLEKALRESQVSGLDLLRDVNLEVKIELGRSRMLVEDVLKLAKGSVVELDRLAGDPVDVFVNDCLVARGEVLVLNDNFCVRVNEIVQCPREEAL